MRIALVNGSMEWGVDGRLHLALAEALTERGHQVLLCGPAGCPLLERGAARDLPVRPIPLPGRPSRSALHQAGLVFSSAGTRIVHACRLQDLWTLSAASRRVGSGLVLTSYLGPDAGPRTPWYRWLRRSVDAYTAPTPLLQQLVMRRFGLPEDSVHLLPHFVDTPRYTAEEVRGRAAPIRRKWEVASQRPVVGALLPLRRGYGARTFLRAAALALPHVAEALWVIVPWPGSQDPRYRAEVETLARDAGSGSLRLVDPEEDTAAVLHALDVLVFPTEREGYARVLLEAMSAGIPVVAVEGPATEFILEHQRSGLLVSPRDPLGLAGAVAQVLGDPDLRQRLAKGGRQRVLSAFSQDIVLAGYERLYESIRGR